MYEHNHRQIRLTKVCILALNRQIITTTKNHPQFFPQSQLTPQIRWVGPLLLPQPVEAVHFTPAHSSSASSPGS